MQRLMLILCLGVNLCGCVIGTKNIRCNMKDDGMRRVGLYVKGSVRVYFSLDEYFDEYGFLTSYYKSDTIFTRDLLLKGLKMRSGNSFDKYLDVSKDSNSVYLKCNPGGHTKDYRYSLADSLIDMYSTAIQHLIDQLKKGEVNVYLGQEKVQTIHKTKSDDGTKMLWKCGETVIIQQTIGRRYDL